MFHITLVIFKIPARQQEMHDSLTAFGGVTFLSSSLAIWELDTFNSMVKKWCQV
jgi:hypothetical protein